MGRAKRSMDFIENTKARKLAFEKRKMNLKKKAYELSTLCDVPVFVLLYPKSESDQPNNSSPLIYPENHLEGRSIIDRYVSIPTSTRKRSLSLQDGVQPQPQSKRRKLGVDFQNNASPSSYPNLIPNLDGLSREHLYNLASHLDHKLQFVQKRIVELGSLVHDNATPFSRFQFCSGGSIDPVNATLCEGLDQQLGSLVHHNATTSFSPVQGFQQFCSDPSLAVNATFCGGFDQQLGSLVHHNSTTPFSPVQGFEFCSDGSVDDFNATFYGGFGSDSGFMGSHFCCSDQQESSSADHGDLYF